ncbi:MAG TPA: COX15/CtaA family protein [Candidatus Angelobacter sp.]|nr:COX15/CtaA family protein [Candidatus Angelobacter sp.]
MSRSEWTRNDTLLRVFAYGSVVSTYILIVIGGYVTTSNSGLGCGESWPLCKGAVFPSLNNPEVVIELTHRLFNSVVGVFILGLAVVAWTRYREAKNVVRLSTTSLVALFAQVLLGMVTVTSSLNPVVGDAHLALASAILAIVVANAVIVRTLTLRPGKLRQ